MGLGFICVNNSESSLAADFNPYWCKLPILTDSKRSEQVVWDRAFPPCVSPQSLDLAVLNSLHPKEAPPECFSLLHFVIDVSASPAQQWGHANGISFHLLFMYISNSWIAGHWCLFSPFMFSNSLFLLIASSIILVFNCISISISRLSGWRHLSPKELSLCPDMDD